MSWSMFQTNSRTNLSWPPGDFFVSLRSIRVAHISQQFQDGERVGHLGSLGFPERH